MGDFVSNIIQQDNYGKLHAKILTKSEHGFDFNSIVEYFDKCCGIPLFFCIDCNSGNMYNSIATLKNFYISGDDLVVEFEPNDNEQSMESFKMIKSRENEFYIDLIYVDCEDDIIREILGFHAVDMTKNII